MNMIKKLLIINCLLFNSIQTFTMSRPSSQKQDQSKNLITYVDVHVNNKLPYKALIRVGYTSDKNKKEYEDQIALPGRSTLKIPLTISSKKMLLKLSTIESIDPQANTLISRIPESEIPYSSFFSLTIDPKKPLATPIKHHRLTTIPEENNEDYTDSHEVPTCSREEVIQAYCPDSIRTPHKEPYKKALPEGLPEGLESFLS